MSKMATISAFDERAEEYDRWYSEEPGSLIYESELKVLESLRLKGLGIEVGIGTGVFSRRLGIPLGVDPSVHMLKIAKKRGIEVIRSVGEYLPLKDRCLDYVLFAFTISFLRSFPDALREAKRVLKRRGDVVVGFISRDSEWGMFYLEKKAKGHRFYQDAHFYSLEEVEQLLQDMGFDIVKYSSCLVQSPTCVKVVESLSDDPEQCGFICVKATKR
jgi:ubiquinone/menaquinone biosynthesis C-methylase UbiE